MAKKIEEEHVKWERRYEDDETISIWSYDSKVSKINPVSVEIKYKKPPQTNSVKRTKIGGVKK
jgi:hypothetical protein